MNSKTFGIFLIFLSLFFNFYFRYPFLNVPLERDEGEYAYISNIIADGGIPYKDAFDQKPPGIFYLYYLIFLLFGKKIIFLRLFVAFFNLISIYFVYRIGRSVKDRDTGLLAALIFAMTSSERRLLGFSANTEIFMLAPVVAGIYFILSYLGSKKPRDLFISGLLFGTAVLFKQPAFLNFACMFGILIYYGMRNKEEFSSLLKACCVFSLAFALPLLLTSLYFYKAGAFNDFKYQVFLHNIAYVGWAIPKEFAVKNFIDTIKFLSQSQMILWCLLFIGMAVMAVKRELKYRELLFITFFFSFFAVSLGKRFTLHYFEQLMPPLALIASLGFFGLIKLLKGNKTPKLFFSVAAVLVVVVFLPYHANSAYSNYSAQELTSAVYSGNPFNENVKAAEFIKGKTLATDRIYVVGSEPQIYFYADRKSLSKYIFYYPLTGGYSDSLAKQKEVVSELKAGLPKFIVYSNYMLSLGIMPQTPKYIFDELDNLLQGYDLVAIISPERPDHVYCDKELDRLCSTDKDLYKGEKLFIYKRKI